VAGVVRLGTRFVVVVGTVVCMLAGRVLRLVGIVGVGVGLGSLEGRVEGMRCMVSMMVAEEEYYKAGVVGLTGVGIGSCMYIGVAGVGRRLVGSGLAEHQRRRNSILLLPL